MEIAYFSGFVFREGTHRGSKVIWVDFKYDQTKNSLVRSLNGRWSNSEKCWYVPDNTHFRTMFGMEIPSVGKAVLSRLSLVNARELQRMKEVLQMKAYSSSTIKTYLVEFAQLLYILKNIPVDSLEHDRLRAYILYCINTLKISESQLHSRLNAIKFYFEQVLHKPDFFAEIPRPKKTSSLPKVLSSTEIKTDIWRSTKPKTFADVATVLWYGASGKRGSETENHRHRQPA